VCGASRADRCGEKRYADIILDRDEALVERAVTDAAELRPIDHAIAFS
jgi:hypothetical protein